jgi:hypothetical protein
MKKMILSIMLILITFVSYAKEPSVFEKTLSTFKELSQKTWCLIQRNLYTSRYIMEKRNCPHSPKHYADWK